MLTHKTWGRLAISVIQKTACKTVTTFQMVIAFHLAATANKEELYQMLISILSAYVFPNPFEFFQIVDKITDEAIEEVYDDTYDQIIKNVSIGSGVILICVTVSLVSSVIIVIIVKEVKKRKSGGIL